MLWGLFTDGEAGRSILGEEKLATLTKEVATVETIRAYAGQFLCILKLEWIQRVKNHMGFKNDP